MALAITRGIASRPRPLLSSHDASSLAERLIRAGAEASTARSATARVLRHVFGQPAATWNDVSLKDIGVGAWARPSLLEMDASLSLSVDAEVPSADGSLRLLLRAHDGALLETVVLPSLRRTTLCLSSQVGCARACSFCETGRLGFARQLEAGGIVDQVRIAQQTFHRRNGGPRIQNLVFMGMGEPFDNLDEVLRAIRLLSDARAFGFAPSRITVSTVGVVEKLGAFFEGCRAELAVSINAPDDERRSALMPINRRTPLAALLHGLKATVPTGRRVLFEYVLFDGVNDAIEDADALYSLTTGLVSRVNVIPANPGPDPALRPPTAVRLDAFVGRLASLGLTTLVRRPRGQDIGGACGQLAGARRGEGTAR